MGLLVVIVLMWVVMPALLYFSCWIVNRRSRRAPVRINVQRPRTEPVGKPNTEAPAKVEI